MSKIPFKTTWSETITIHREIGKEKVSTTVKHNDDELFHQTVDKQLWLKKRTETFVDRFYNKLLCLEREKITWQDALNIKAYAKSIQERLNVLDNCKKTCQNTNCDPDTYQSFQQYLAEETARLNLHSASERKLNKSFMFFNKTLFNKLFKRIIKIFN